MYILLHKVIRNDEHCPICRKYYISFHNNKNDTLIFAKNIIDDDNLKTLENNNYLWIDEWVRRSNGDQFNIFPIKKNKAFDLANSIYNTFEDPLPPKFMLLNIQVDKSLWCSDNIQFYIEFHDTVEAAFSRSDLHDNFKDDLLNFRPVWSNIKDDYSDDIDLSKPNTDNSKGVFHQIIPIELNKQIYLNEYCTQISYNTWFAKN